MNVLHNGILPERLVIVNSEWKAYSYPLDKVVR